MKESSPTTTRENDMKLEALEALEVADTLTTAAAEEVAKKKESVRMWTVVYSVLTTSLLSLLVGASIAFSSPALVELTQLEDPKFRFNTQLSDIFGAAIFIGGIFGGPFGGWITDKFGRKTSLMLDSFPYLCGNFIILSSYLAKNGVVFKVLIMVGRLLVGIGLGWAHVAVGVYIGEISPARSRGAFATVSELSLTTGIMAALALGSIPGSHYYITALVMVGIVTLFVFMALWIPETPRWLLLHSKNPTEAVAVMRCLKGPKYSKIDQDISEIKSTIPKKRPPLCEVMKQLVCERSTLVPFLLLLFVFSYQRGSGVGPLLAYVGPIFIEVGVPSPNLTATFSIGGMKVLVTLVSVVFVEFAGRKLLLAVSSAGMFLSILMLSIHSYITRPSLCNNSTLLWNSTVVTTMPPTEDVTLCSPHLYPLVIVAIMLFHIFYSLGVGPVPWVLLSEYLPLKVRGVAGGIAVAAAWSSAAVVTGSFLSFSEAVGAWSAWWTLAGINLVGFLVIVLFFVETKGKKLEEVQELFTKSKICCFAISPCKLCHKSEPN